MYRIARRPFATLGDPFRTPGMALGVLGACPGESPTLYQRDPEQFFWPGSFLEAWGTKANTPHEAGWGLRRQGQQPLVSGKCVVCWPWYPRPPKNTWPTKSGNLIVWVSTPAGFWTGHRRIWESRRLQPASKPIQNGRGLRAPPFWMVFEAVKGVWATHIDDSRPKSRTELKPTRSHVQTSLTNA
jgi:hypothetical protein